MTRFVGNAYGAVQATVKDQVGSYLPGDQAFANDNMLIDSYIVGEATGIQFGLGVKKASVDAIWTPGAYPVSGPPKRPGANQFAALLPVVGSALADFEGVLLRSAAGQSDENGVGFMPYQSVAAVARKNRAASRVLVKTYGNVALTSTPYWITSDAGTKTVGAFSIAADATSTVDISSIAKFVSKVIDYNAVTGVGMAILEFFA